MLGCNRSEQSFVTGCLDVIVVNRALLLDVIVVSRALLLDVIVVSRALLLDAWM